MKRALIIGLVLANFLNANEILNDIQKSILDKKEQQGKKQADLTKDSWIEPMLIEAKQDRLKTVTSEEEINSSSITIESSQDIFRSGGIEKTIQKGKLEATLNTRLVGQEKKQLVSRLYEYVINLKKIDLQIEKLFYLVSSKKIEIEKNKASYTNGIIDITVLDESVIELNDLNNQKDDLELQKLDILRIFEKYSDLNYKTIDLAFLEEVNLEEYLNKNTNIKIKELEYEKSSIEEGIVASSYLPKVSLYGNYSYEDKDNTKSDDSYIYGLKLTLPIDYNSNKKKEIARLDKLIYRNVYFQSKLDEENFYRFYIKRLKVIDNKILNVEQTLERYKSLYKNVNALYKNSLKTIDDVRIMENRIASSKLDKKIFSLDKKVLLNTIYGKVEL